MKTHFTPCLHLTDVSARLDPALLKRARLVCRARRKRCRDGRVLRTWQQTAGRYLLRLFPKAWIYRGGRHVAVHAFGPRSGRPDRYGRRPDWDGQAGPCLFRVIEVNSARDVEAEGLLPD